MPHNEECREIFRRLMGDEAKVKNAEARRAEFEEKIRRKMEKRSREVEAKESSGRGSEKDGSREAGKDSGAMEREKGDTGEELLGS